MNSIEVSKTQRFIEILGYIFVGLVIGYLLFDRSREVTNLRSKVAEAERQLQANRMLEVHRPRWHTPAQEAPAGANATATNGPSPLITEADIQEALAMNERAANGEYILQFERPVDRKLMEARIKAFAAQTASNNAPALEKAFDQAGVAPDKVQQLEKHQEKIMWASLQVEQAMQQVMSARRDYDQRVRALLPGDTYAAYRQYEDSQAASREYGLFAQYAQKNQYPLDSSYQPQLAELIQQAQAYTQTWPHGPYDALPQIGLGREMVTAQLQDQISQVAQAASALDQAASRAGLPGVYISMLEGYYAQAIQQRKDTINRINNPPGPVTANK